ncbi:MAG TPA: hypothetical protein VKR31_09515 [Rhizomicrobium sp.]|nr:hypothetical protein [Rhizomicrobium sp.]
MRESRPRFDDVKERLLRAGIAPRHVRRYIAELADHFDDLVSEAMAGGRPRSASERDARVRLGSDQDLAKVMLDRSELRAWSARYPWAVFVLGPAVLPIAALVGAVFFEIFCFDVIANFYKNPAHLPPPVWFNDIVAAWNWCATHALPLIIAILLCLMGIRQRMKPAWICAAVTIACVAGAFWKLSWYDNGHHGELMLGSGLGPPFPRDLIVAGIWRTLTDLAIVFAVWIAVTRWRGLTLHRADRHDPLLAAEIRNG